MYPILILLLAGASPLAGGPGPQEGDRRPADPPPTFQSDAPLGRSASIPREWDEDPGKRRRALATLQGGEEYRRALEETGMADHLELRASGAPESTSAWTQTGPVGGFGYWGDNGRVSGVEAHTFGTQNWVYVGGCAGGLWRSDMASIGVWECLGDELPNPSVRAFAVHPTNPQRIVVGTGDYTRYKGAGMYATSTGGASWYSVNMSATPQYFYRVRYQLNSTQVMVAASDNGLWRSTNGGDDWTVEEWGHWTDLVLHPTNASVMYACRMGGGVYKSTNGGADWTPLSSPNLPAAASWGRASMAICRDWPDTVAIVVEHGSVLVGVYRTLNGGSAWTNVTSNLGTFGAGQIPHAQAIAIRPTDRDEILLGAISIARSYWNSGAGRLDWHIGETAAGIPIGHADVTQLYFTPLTGDFVMWIANDGGLFYHWYGLGTAGANGNSTTGLAISQIDHLDADRTMAGIGLQDNGVLRTTSSGVSWTRISTGDGGGNQLIDPEHYDMWFWAGMGWNPYRAIYGQSVEFLPQPTGSVANLHYDPVADRVWLAAKQAIYSAGAYDSPVIWTPRVTSGLHTAGDHALRRLWGSKLESGTLFVSFGYAYDGDVTVVHKQGTSWVKNLTTGLAPTGHVDSVTPSSEWPGECWVGLNASAGQPKIYHTTDYGQTWEDISGTLTAVTSVYAVVPTPFNPRQLFAATNVGVYRSQNGGQSWSPFQDGMPVVAVRGMAFVADDTHTGTHKLRAATYGRSTWERDIVAPPIVYVDGGYFGVEDGSFQNPYDTVGEAVTAAPSGAIVAIRSNTYVEPQTVTKNVLLMTYLDRSVIR